MAAKTILEMIYANSGILDIEVPPEDIRNTYIPMVVQRIKILVPLWPHEVVDDTTGSILDDKIIAEWSICFLKDEKGLSAYNPDTGEVLRTHCEVAKELLLELYGIETDDGLMFPKHAQARRGFGGMVLARGAF